MPNVSLNLVVIRSTDFERAASFYAVLGLTFVKHRHGTGPEHSPAKSARLCSRSIRAAVTPIPPLRRGLASRCSRSMLS